MNFEIWLIDCIAMRPNRPTCNIIIMNVDVWCMPHHDGEGMVGFGKAERPPVSGKSSLPHPTIESEVTVAFLRLMLNKLFFLFFRRIPTERERERESGIETSSRSKNCLPVEN